MRMAKGRLAAGILLLLVWIATGVAIAEWYDPFRFQVLSGDDLRSFNAAKEGFTALNNGSISIYKFRPVTVFVLTIVASWTGGEFREIAAIGIMIHAATAVAFCVLLHRVIRVPLMLAAGLAAIATFSRFTAYLFMQEQAIFEGLGVLLFLAIAATALRFLERPELTTAALLAALLLIIVHVHERYLVLLAPFAVLGGLTFRRNRRAAVALLIGACMATGVNLAIKKVFLRTPVLIGTTTQPIEMNLTQLGRFLRDGALNLAGVNRGESSLSLQDYSESPTWVQAVSVAALVLSVSVLVAGAIGAARKRGEGDRHASFTTIAFLVSVTAALLLSASVTFRQEYRWLYPAYLAALMLGACCLKAAGRRSMWRQAAAAALIALSISREVYLARWHTNFYAFEAYEITNNLFTALHQISDLDKTTSVSIRGVIDYSDWYFQGDTFARSYQLPRLRFDSGGEDSEPPDPTGAVLGYEAMTRKFKLLHPAASLGPAER